MIYVLVFLITATTTGFLVRANSKVAIIVCALILASFAALRGPDVAADFTVYESWYLHPSEGDGLLERAGLFEAIYFQLSTYGDIEIGLNIRLLRNINSSSQKDIVKTSIEKLLKNLEENNFVVSLVWNGVFCFSKNGSGY